MADRSIKVRLEAEVGGYKRGMSDAARATDNLAKSQKGALERTSAFWQANRADIDQVGSSLAVMGAAGTAALAGVTKLAMDWESAWAGVTKTVDGTAEEMASLEKGLRGLAKVLPASHTEIAAVAEAAGQLGVETKNVQGFTRTMIDLGETTNLSANDAATQLSRFMNIMGTSQSDVDRLGSSVVGLGNNFATTEAEIVELGMRLAGAGKQAGLSESDVLGFATAMSSVGIEAEAGGTALSMTMKRIGSEVETNGALLGTFAQVAGMSAEQFKTAWGQDAAGALSAFIAGLGQTESLGMSANAVLSELGITGIRESDSLLRLSSAQGLVNEALATGASAYEENVALSDEAAKRYETTAAKAEMAWNAMKDAGIEFGSYVLPVLAQAAEGVADLAGWFAQLPEPVKQVITGLGGLASVAALAAGGALRLVGSVSDSYLAMKRLSAEAPRLASGLKRVGVAAGVAGAALTAFAIGQAYDGGEATQGLQEIEDGLKRVAKGASAADTVFKNFDERKIWESDVQGLRDAEEILDRISQNTLFGDAQRGLLSGINGLTDLFGYDSRTDLQKQEQDLRAYLDTLATQVPAATADAIAAFQGLNEQVGGTDESAQKLINASPALKDALIGVASEAGYTTDDASLLAIALGEVDIAADEVDSSTRGAASAAVAAAEAMQAEADAANAAAEAVLAKARANADGISAEIRFEEATDRARATIEENGKATDLSTEKGRQNMEALLGMADATLGAAEQMSALGASQEAVDGKIEAGRRRFESLARAAGFSREQVASMSRELGLVPGTVTTQVQVLNVGGAISQVQALNSTLNSINGKTVTAAVAVKQYGQGAMADGGVRERAAGALDEPQIRPGAGAGVTQVSRFGPVTWAEGETEWEAFIPGARSKRPRALAIWEETGRRLGAFEALGAESFAAGGLRSSASLRTAERRVKRLVSQVRSSRRSGNDKRTRRLEDQLRDARSALADLREARVDLAVDARRGRLSEQASGGLSSAYSLVDQVRDAAGDSALTKGTRKSLSSVAKSSEVAFRKLYANAERVEIALEKARDHLQEMQQISDGLKSSLSGGFQLTDAYTQWSDGLGNVAGKSITAAGMVSGGKAYADKLKRFGASIKKLADFGLSSVVLQEIAALGPDEGLEVANQLLAGGKKSVQELNGVYTSIASASGFIGDQATRNFRAADGTFYAGGVGQAQGRVDSLEKSMSKIEASIGKWGDKIARILGKAYGVKMASGGWVTGGIKGVDSVPLTAMPDEYLVNAKAAQQYGPLLESINSGRGVPVLAAAYPAQTNVNVALDKGSLAGALDGVGVTMLVDGKPMRATIRTEMNAAFTAAGRGY